MLRDSYYVVIVASVVDLFGNDVRAVLRPAACFGWYTCRQFHSLSVTHGFVLLGRSFVCPF